MSEYIPIEKRKYTSRTKGDFQSWINVKYQDNQLGHPDTSQQPCFCDNGLVRWRNEWDIGDHICTENKGEIELTKFQKFLKDFFTTMYLNDPKYRGILLYHGMGSGKTCSSIAMSEELTKNRQVVFLSPASLKGNFIRELKKCGSSEYHIPSHMSKDEEYHKNVERKIRKKFFFISYDSPFIIKKLNELPDGLNDKLLIVDEVHNLISMIHNQGKKGPIIFTSIMEARNLKIIFLSGTPIINDPFEVSYLFNMLTGYIYPDNSETPGESIINPEQYFSKKRTRNMLFSNSVEFEDTFIDKSNPNHYKLKNESMFKRRIQGLLSYYKQEQPSDNILPKHTEEIIELEMSQYQYSLYKQTRNIEREFEKQMAIKFGKKSKNTTRRNIDLLQFQKASAKRNKPDLFRAFSRQTSNFAFPKEFLRPLPGGKLLDPSAEDVVKIKIGEIEEEILGEGLVEDYGKKGEDEKYYQMLTDVIKSLSEKKMEYFGNMESLKTYSAKYAAILERIKKSKGPSFVYSNFRTAEGIGIFSLVLEANGYMEYDTKIKKNSPTPLPNTIDTVTGKEWKDLNNNEKKKFKPLTYLIWSDTGSGKDDLRRRLINTFNSDDNKEGKLINVFLTTKSGAEGINLMNIRQVHIMEPYWNDILIRQAISRAIRRCSHATLPEKDRKVEVYRYLSVHNSQKSKDVDHNKRQFSTDQAILRIAENKKSIINSIQKAMMEGAIDCSININHNNYKEEKDPIKCFNYNSKEKGAFKVDIKEEKTDKDYLSENKVEQFEFRTITIKGNKYRIQESDFQAGRTPSSMQKNPKSYEGQEVILYYLVDNKPYVKFYVKNGVFNIVRCRNQSCV